MKGTNMYAGVFKDTEACNRTRFDQYLKHPKTFAI